MLKIRNVWRFSLLTFALLVVVTISAVLYAYISVPLVHHNVPLTLKVPPGTGSGSLARRLKGAGVIHSPWFWKYLIALSSFGRELKAGEYQIPSGVSLSALVEQIIDGQVYLRELTLVEGWTYQKIKHTLETNPALKHVLLPLTRVEMMKILGSYHSNPEGLLFPDTYFYTWGDSDLDLIKQAYGKMQQIINEAWPSRAPHLPYHTAYSALIVASLVEKETAVVRERPLIASVIVNRLRKKMRLQIDPTVLYGLNGNNDKPLTHKDLQRLTPYNTYLVRGLPPTPIAMPSLTSIRAALHPAKTNYYYFVARGDGSHQFSQTYAEHLDAVRKYLSIRRVVSEVAEKHLKSSGLVCQFKAKNVTVDALRYLLEDESKCAQFLATQ